MLKGLMSVAAMASVVAAPAIAQAAPLATSAAAVAVQDTTGGDEHGESTVGYVALAAIVVIGVFVALGATDDNDSASA